MLATTLSLIAYAALLAFALAACSLPLLGIFQQEGYAGGALCRFFYRRKNMILRRHELLSIALLLASALFGLCFSFGGGEAANLASVLACTGICALFCFSFKRALKVPMKRTPRATRLAVIYYLVLFGALFGAMYGLVCAANAIGYALSRVLCLVPLCLFPFLLPLLLCLANLLSLVYELPRQRSLIKRAERTISASGCVKVGITGSFGKTSVKHIAAQMLAKKFRVIATPSSFNTPLGIARCVNEGGLDCDIFLAEMGARRKGDIEELCALVHPTVGVVTGVGLQHIETFGSLEAVRAEKGVLAREAETAILGSSAFDLREGAIAEGKDFAAEDIELLTDGTAFTLRLHEDSARVRTDLLGRHAAEDIALAAALCNTLGMSFEEIVSALPSVEPVPHRLQRIDGARTVLDDSYNSNIEGAKNAIEVLKCFEGEKVVVTPGLVELGELEEEKNEELGKELLGIDRILLVGETRVRAVRDGYVSAGGDDRKVTIVPSLDAAEKLLQEEFKAEGAVLFLNDLPDKYL